MLNRAADILERVRGEAPLVHAITNYVTINDCANILLAFGASPAMCEAVDETYDFARISGGIYINLGTLTKEQEMAAVQAVLGANSAGRPVVVDPAGCGAIPRKTAFLNHLGRIGKISLIKGNMGEIKILAGMEANVKGVDAADEEQGIQEAAVCLARQFGCAVAATGPVDLIADSRRAVRVDNGVALMTKVTGAGCMLGALCTATAAVCGDAVEAAVAAVTAMCVAGELAFQKAKAPGSFRVALMDSIYELGREQILERGKLS